MAVGRGAVPQSDKGLRPNCGRRAWQCRRVFLPQLDLSPSTPHSAIQKNGAARSDWHRTIEDPRYYNQNPFPISVQL